MSGHHLDESQIKVALVKSDIDHLSPRINSSELAKKKKNDSINLDHPSIPNDSIVVDPVCLVI